MRIPVLLFTVVFCAAMQGQQPTPKFVLNPSKPYVYLQFDHVGSRKPIQKEESQSGIWLRIVNNCREPILVPTFGLPSGDPGVGVLDEVVPSTDVLTISTDSTFSGAEPKPSPIHPPQGYSAEMYSLTRVLPGKDILFSIPRNQVSDKWYVRVWFMLDVTKPNVGPRPRTYLEFSEGQIPSRH